MNANYLELPEGKIAYDDQGSGPLVLLVPSMGDLRGEYRFLAPLLAEAGYRAVSMDVRGHGETSVDWPDYSVTAIGSDMLALIRSLKAGPSVIVGTSMAAGAGVWAAAEAPEAVAGLVAIGPFVRGEMTLQNRLMGLFFSILLSRPWGPAAWMRYFKTLFPTRPPEDFEAYSAALRSNLEEPGRLEALKAMMLASKEASQARLSRVNVPVKVLMGSQDPDFKDQEAEARWVAEQLRGSYTMVEGAGHYPHAELPEVTTPLILSFLESIKETDERYNRAPQHA